MEQDRVRNLKEVIKEKKAQIEMSRCSKQSSCSTNKNVMDSFAPYHCN
jgi:hypothetical protein